MIKIKEVKRVTDGEHKMSVVFFEINGEEHSTTFHGHEVLDEDKVEERIDKLVSEFKKEKPQIVGVANRVEVKETKWNNKIIKERIK